MFHLKRTICALLVLATLAFAITVEAATFYVATTGNDSNAGTQALPFNTIKKGVSVLTPGDTLLIRGGSYVGPGQFDGTPSGTSWAQPVTVKAFPGETVTIIAVTSGDHVINLSRNNHHIILDGLIVDAQKIGNNPIKIHSEGTYESAHHIRVQNSTVKNGTGQGVMVPGKAETGGCCNEFINVKVYGNGTSTQFDHGMYFSTSDNIVDGCEIYNNAAFGIHIYGGGPNNARNIVRNSIIRDHAAKAAVIFGEGSGHQAYNNVFYGNASGINVLYGGGAAVYNNTIYDNKSYGILLFNTATSTIENNITFGNGLTGIYIEASAVAQTFRNNLSAQNPSGNFRDNSGKAVLSNNLFGDQYDPKFVNLAAHDFRLQTGSAAIDKGLPMTALSVDLAGNPRPLGPANDIGAFEFSTGRPAPPRNLRVQ
jgi:parallel beta-helix repeat protein